MKYKIFSVLAIVERSWLFLELDNGQYVSSSVICVMVLSCFVVHWPTRWFDFLSSWECGKCIYRELSMKKSLNEKYDSYGMTRKVVYIITIIILLYFKG